MINGFRDNISLFIDVKKLLLIELSVEQYWKTRERYNKDKLRFDRGNHKKLLCVLTATLDNLVFTIHTLLYYE